MARVNKVEACIFCGFAPCRCNEKPKAEPKKRAPKRSAVTPIQAPPTERVRPSTPGPDFSAARPIDRTEADSKVFAPIVEVAKPTVVVAPPEPRDDPDADLKKALRTLHDAGMLHPQEVHRQKRLLTANDNASVLIQANAWKERNATS